MPPTTDTPATPRTERCGDGIRRDHRTGCRRTGRCDCPYSFWKPRTATATRERARIHGTLADARRAKRQAEDAATRYRRTRANQLAGIVAMPTLNEWFDQLMHAEWARVREVSRERRVIDYRRLRDTLGTKRLDQLTVPVIHQWLHHQIDIDGNRRCVQAAHDTLCAMLAFAERHRLVVENAAKHVRYPVEHLESWHQRVLTHDEYRTLLDGAETLAERTMIRVMCEAGLRAGETIALQIGDLHLDDGLIHIQRRHYRLSDGTTDIDTPKSHKDRWAAINATLVAELRQVTEGRENAPEAYLWTRTNRYTGHEPHPYTASGLKKMLSRVAKSAGMHEPVQGRYISPHLLRATGASLAVAAGVPEHIAAKQLGHARVETTKRHYLRLPVIEPLRAIGDVFDVSERSSRS
jgi:integrase